MQLDTLRLNIAVAESGLTTKEILEKAKISTRTWARALKSQPIRPYTAGKIAQALTVPVQSLLTMTHQ